MCYIVNVTEKGLTIDAQDGSLRIGSIALVITAELTRSEALRELKAHPKQTKDYEFLYAEDITLGGQPARVSLCFFKERLEFVSLSATPPGWEQSDQAAIDAEISFMQTELGYQLGCSLRSGRALFPWGEAWANADYKSGYPSAGVRYKKKTVRPWERVSKWFSHGA